MIAGALLVLALGAPPTVGGQGSGELPTAGVLLPELRPFDELMREVVDGEHVPGAALAVMRDGRLLLARGYGWADREAREPVEPVSLFRIASVSKPITAVAVARLVERGELSYEDRVVDVLDLDAWGTIADERWRAITVRQLLQHTGGFDRSASFDPMFRSVEFARDLGVPPPAGARDVVRAMLALPLDFDPGERYAYSNFGYTLLGRVLEQRSGTDYESFVRADVWARVGVRSARVGRTRLEDRAPGEVRYYASNGRERGRSVLGPELGAPVKRAYGAWYLEAMDAHGAWIASAPDLLRFLRGLEESAPAPLLAPASVAELFARPDLPSEEGAAWYGLGFSVRRAGDGVNAWHGGLLTCSTSSLLVRRHDGLCWAVLFNTDRAPGDRVLSGVVDGALHRAAARVEAWPDVDLFDRY